MAATAEVTRVEIDLNAWRGRLLTLDATPDAKQPSAWLMGRAEVCPHGPGAYRTN